MFSVITSDEQIATGSPILPQVTEYENYDRTTWEKMRPTVEAIGFGILAFTGIVHKI